MITLVHNYKEHTMNINKVNWDPFDEMMILSASHDFSVKIWVKRNIL